MKTSDVPLVFCDSASIGVLDGPGESVHLTFTSTVGNADGTTSPVLAFRVAMTKLAFKGLAESCGRVSQEITARAAGAGAKGPTKGKAN